MRKLPALFLLATSALTLMGVGCEPADPCDNYVDYICDCHADDDRPGYDCETLSVTYQSADPELQDECQVALNEQRQEDSSEGYDCATDTGL